MHRPLEPRVFSPWNESGLDQRSIGLKLKLQADGILFAADEA